MRKNFVTLCLTLLLTLVFAGVSHAEENPFKGLTQEQIIQKYFDGRQLDTLEGIWLDDKIKPNIIIKANLINIDNSKNYDYFIIKYSDSPVATPFGIRKTQYSSLFESEHYKSTIRLVSPTTFMADTGYLPYGRSPLYSLYTRIYPTEMK
jgi:hypothetical protein